MLLAASFLMFRGFQHSMRRGTRVSRQDHLLMVRFDPRLRAVRRGADAALLRAAGRARARDAGSRERGAHAEPSARAGRLRPRRLRARRVSDAARPRELHVDDGHRRRRVLRDDGDPDPARPRLPGVRHRGRAARRRRQRAVREALLAGRRCGGQAHPARQRHRRAGRDRRRRADDQVPRRLRQGRWISSTCRSPSIRSREWSCCCGRAAIRCSWSGR